MRRLSTAEIAQLKATLAERKIGFCFLHVWCWRRGWMLPPLLLTPFFNLAAGIFVTTLGTQVGLFYLRQHLPPPYDFELFPGVIYLPVVCFTIYREGAKHFWWILWLLFGAFQIYTQFNIAVGQREMNRPLFLLTLDLQVIAIHFAIAISLATIYRLQARRKQLAPWQDMWRQATVAEAF
jgi:hypothetical protein